MKYLAILIAAVALYLAWPMIQPKLPESIKGPVNTVLHAANQPIILPPAEVIRLPIQQPITQPKPIQQAGDPIWPTLTPTVQPSLITATPNNMTECYAGSFYSCPDLTAIAVAPAATTQAFLEQTPVVQYELQVAMVEYCNKTPKDKRSSMMGPICEGAGL